MPQQDLVVQDVPQPGDIHPHQFDFSSAQAWPGAAKMCRFCVDYCRFSIAVLATRSR